MPPDTERRNPVNILMVDDRPENLLALEAILEPLHQNLVRANSGEEALKALLTRDFAVILLDVQMPGMNGFDTARLIKARERSRHIPIIFLTAISKEEAYVFEGYSVGAVDYMFKPFQPDILRSKVAVFVDLYRKQEQIRLQDDLLRESEKRELELRHRAELRETQARLAEVVDGAMDAIIMFDDARRVLLFNEAAERMFCVQAREILGKEVGTIFPEATRAEYVGRLLGAPQHEADDTCATEKPPSRHLESFTARRATGEEFPLEASISRLDEGSPVYTMIGRDVTERVRAEQELKTQAESLARTTAELRVANDELQQRQLELERAMSARSRFYASMSHELRTPINAILGYSTLLLENIYGPLNEKQAEGIQRTHKAAKHLLELVNDVLDLSKIEAGKVDLKLQPVSFPDLLEDLFITVRPLADDRGSTLALEHEGGKRVIVTDPRRVRQILLNLLSNAIKFGQGKPIRVRSAAREDGGHEIEVIDQGIGIAPADLERIFDEFVQIGKGAHHQEGTGLGLPISKRLAELLHGSLEVESELGRGSCFRLVLPPDPDHKLDTEESARQAVGAA
ncbi:MAG TPA: ATP-binding protein [Gemmatimonadaceae bacterium]|nr:ATP-binding protein [Gemmatimonadaceae bacterium]